MNIFQSVKEAVTTKQAAESYGIKVQRNGMCRCPFHNDKTPSMKLDQNFICFGCQEKGDVIKFTQLLFDLTPYEAAQKLVSDFQIPFISDTKNRNRGKPLPTRKIGIPKKTEEQKFQETVSYLYGVYCDYRLLLKNWQERYSPKTPEEEWHPRFTEALQRSAYAEYLLDELFYGTAGDKVAVILEKGKEAKALEQRIREYRSCQTD